MSETDVAVAPKLSTFSQFTPVEETQIAPIVEQSATVDQSGAINMPQFPEPIVETTAEQVATTETETTTEAVEELNNSSFAMPDFNEPAATTTTTEAATTSATPITDWRQAIKAVDRKELLKELGVDDFSIELSDHIKNGGQAADYLNAKARDWNAVSELDIIRDEFKAKFPNLTAAEIERKISRKYSIESLDDDEKEDGMIDLKSDAYELRQQRIERDKKLIIPSNKVPEVDIDAMTKQVLESQQRIKQKSYDDSVELFNNHAATKELNQSKRVALDLGDNGKFSFTVDKPELITRAIYDSKLWNQLTSDEKGEPNVPLLQEMILYAANRKKFTNDLVNYGKSLGLQNVVAEGQNAKRPIGSVAKTDTSPTYKQGTYGSLQGQN